MAHYSYWIGRSVSRLLGTIEAVGLVHAAKLIATAYLPCSKARMCKVRLPGLPHPIFLRSNSTDINVFMQIFSMAEYDMTEFPQFRAVRRKYADLVSAGKLPLIVDCGANIGLSALWWIRLFPEAVVVAVEPAEGNFEMLKRNTALYGSIRCVKAAVWDTRTAVGINNPAAGAWAYQMREVDEPRAALVAANGILETVTVPDLIGDHPKDAVLLIKVDIEGGEKDLFRTNTGWLDATPLLIIETHDKLRPFEMTSTTFIREISRRSFEICFGGENAFVFFQQDAMSASS